MNVRVAINGFGRVGRCFLRSAYERQSPVEIVAVNDVADSHTLAALLRHDSVYGRFAPSVESDDDSLTIDGSRVTVFSEAEPAALPWRDLEVDLVIESTGRFRTRAGAQRPSRRRRPQGGHHGAREGRRPGRCQSRPRRELRRGLRPGAPSHRHERLMHDQLPGTGREGAPRDDRHPPRADDNCPRLYRRSEPARRPAQGPPQGESRRHQHGADVDRRREGARARDPRAPGPAARIRSPSPAAYWLLVDLTVESERPTTAEEVNAAFADRADSGELEGILAYSEEPLVATDVIGSSTRPSSTLRSRRS